MMVIGGTESLAVTDKDLLEALIGVQSVVLEFSLTHVPNSSAQLNVYHSSNSSI
jgi:hypothetical protein